MKNIKIIDKDELDEKLLHTVEIIDGIIIDFYVDIKKKIKKYGIEPDSGTYEEDELADKYWDKIKLVDLVDEAEKKILIKIHKYLMQQEEE